MQNNELENVVSEIATILHRPIVLRYCRPGDAYTVKSLI